MVKYYRKKEGHTMIFDTHAHYDDDAFEIDRYELLKSMPEQGIGRIVNSGADMDTNYKAKKLAEDFSYIWASFGLHPTYAKDWTPEYLAELETLCKWDRCVAVGEIGLDYYWDDSTPAEQKVCFEQQMDLARRVGKPIVVHSREAAQDTYDMMKAFGAEKLGGTIHCFSYGTEMAKLFVDMGFYIGVGGVVTFKNSRKLKEVVEYLPLENILLETDCPYLAPTPFRGKRNDSSMLPYVVEEIAALKGVSKELVEEITWQNACKLYGLK